MRIVNRMMQRGFTYDKMKKEEIKRERLQARVEKLSNELMQQMRR